MATMMTKKTSSKALPAGQRVQQTQNGLSKGHKSNAADKDKHAGIKPTGKLAGRSETPAVTKRTEAPMSPMGRAAKTLYPSAK